VPQLRQNAAKALARDQRERLHARTQNNLLGVSGILIGMAPMSATIGGTGGFHRIQLGHEE